MVPPILERQVLHLPDNQPDAIHASEAQIVNAILVAYVKREVKCVAIQPLAAISIGGGLKSNPKSPEHLQPASP